LITVGLKGCNWERMDSL